MSKKIIVGYMMYTVGVFILCTGTWVECGLGTALVVGGIGWVLLTTFPVIRQIVMKTCSEFMSMVL